MQFLIVGYHLIKRVCYTHNYLNELQLRIFVDVVSKMNFNSIEGHFRLNAYPNWLLLTYGHSALWSQ
jgi:hypothetical protein